MSTFASQNKSKQNMKLNDIAEFVTDKISSGSISLENYVTTDSLLQNKRGREAAQNLPPMQCALTHYKRGDVLVANIRPYLKKVWFADSEGGCSSDVLVFRAKNGHYPSFLYTALMQDVFFDYAMSGAKGSKMPRGDKDQIMRYELPTFSSVEEENIGNMMVDIMSKININRQINDNLEAMAKLLYDYWFVQFDFPNEEGKPYKSSGGTMVWNEKLKREIPQGWSVLSVNDIAASVRGVSYAKEDLVDSNNGVLVLRGNNIQDNHLIYDSNVAYIPSSFVSEDQRIRPLDIIMTMSSGSKEHIGKSAMFQFASEDTFGAFLTKFTAKEHCAYLLFNLFNSQYFKAKIKSIACGTGINNLTNQTFDEIYIVMPEDELLLEFDKKQSQIFAEIGLIEKSNVELTKQRDELLPLLMNGQASVNYHLSVLFITKIMLYYKETNINFGYERNNNTKRFRWNESGSVS